MPFCNRIEILPSVYIVGVSEDIQGLCQEHCLPRRGPQGYIVVSQLGDTVGLISLALFFLPAGEFLMLGLLSLIKGVVFQCCNESHYERILLKLWK